MNTNVLTRVLLADDHHVALFSKQPVADPGWRIAGLQSTDGFERCQRIAESPEPLGCLPRAQLAAVPDSVRRDAARHAVTRERFRMRPTAGAQRPLRVDVRTHRVSVMHQVDHRAFYF